MKICFPVFGAIIALFVQCAAVSFSAVNPTVEVELFNDSKVELRNAEVWFGSNVCKWGVVVPNSSASFMNFPHPITEIAEIRWEADGKVGVKRIDIGEIYKSGRSGRLTFIFLREKIDVRFRERR